MLCGPGDSGATITGSLLVWAQCQGASSRVTWRCPIRGDTVAAARGVLRGLAVDYVGVATFDGQPTLVIAARAGVTRLIDNVPLDQPELAGLGDVGS